MQEIRDTIVGFGTFFKKLAELTSMLGFSTFVLLVMVLLFSSGLSAVGLPRGKPTLLISLAGANGLWLLWERSMNPGDMAFVPTMLKSNGIILAPLVCFYIILWGWPRVRDRGLRVYRDWRVRRRGGMTR